MRQTRTFTRVIGHVCYRGDGARARDNPMVVARCAISQIYSRSSLEPLHETPRLQGRAYERKKKENG